jgi:Na+/H+ antiporter NhaB
MKARLVVILLSILLVTIALLLLFFRDATQGTIAFEIAKSLLQPGVVAVVGAVVSLAMTDYQLEQSHMDKDRDREHQDRNKERDVERQRYEYREDLLTSTLSRTVAAYSRAKRARRLLRARSGAAPGGLGSSS